MRTKCWPARSSRCASRSSIRDRRTSNPPLAAAGGGFAIASHYGNPPFDLTTGHTVVQHRDVEYRKRYDARPYILYKPSCAKSDSGTAVTSAFGPPIQQLAIKKANHVAAVVHALYGAYKTRPAYEASRKQCNAPAEPGARAEHSKPGALDRLHRAGALPGERS